jgi:alkylhydroperoxidase family enzyme
MTAATPSRISRFPVPEIKDLPEDIRARVLAVQEKSGFVPNVFLVLAHRPDEFRAFFAYHFESLQRHGFDTDDVWDIAGIAAFFSLSNRLANVTSMRPNDEFYTLGR